MIQYKEKPDSSKKIRKILHPVVEEWFFSTFKDFSITQRYGIFEIHSRKNVLISSPTGSTKTLTAFLSILNELIDSSLKGKLEDKVYCVYVSPLKSLNYDIEVNLKEPLKEMERIAKKKYGIEKLGIRIGVRTGDTTQKEKDEMRKHAPHILITTPESLGILITSKSFSEKMKDVQWGIIDEIHALCENKRGTHLALSFEHLERLSRYLCRVGLSATVSPLEDVAHFLVGNEIKDGKVVPRDCTIIDVSFIKKMDIKVITPVKAYLETDLFSVDRAIYAEVHKLIQAHKTTLIFTNTRAATERVVDILKSRYYNYYNDENIAPHHSSLSKEMRKDVEKKLREGKLKCVVSSTSLELGIDIGYIDLVILLSSPKSVARALQRSGRSGHRLHDTTKGRVIAVNRDDLIECSVMIKDALDGKIDKVHIPKNALDVLAQQIFSFVLSERIDIKELYNVCRQAYPYSNLSYANYLSVLDYLAGKYDELGEKRVYGKIWINDDNTLSPRGKLSRMIYHTNVGTIPEESRVTVKNKDEIIGYIDEPFLEKLNRGDVFVLGGSTYMFRYARGMTAHVVPMPTRPPTIPRWYSEMLPLSFELGTDISSFLEEVREKIAKGIKEGEVISFIQKRLMLEYESAKTIYHYVFEQYKIADVPSIKRLIAERYKFNDMHYVVYHSRFGRRVNDVFSRVSAYVLSKENKTALNVSITDYGFTLSSTKRISKINPLELLKDVDINKIAEESIENAEILRRRFRHCAARGLMILRQYKGHRKNAGIQQLSSMVLLSAVRSISNDFPILKEARREVLEDAMDIENFKKILKWYQEGKYEFKESKNTIPSPFAFNLLSQYASDSVTAEDRHSFMMRLNRMVQAKIALDEGKKEGKTIYYKEEGKEEEKKGADSKLERIREMFTKKAKENFVNPLIKREIEYSFFNPKAELSKYTINWIKQVLSTDEEIWPKEIINHLKKLFDEQAKRQ